MQQSERQSMHTIKRWPSIATIALLAAITVMTGCKRAAPPGSAGATAEPSAATTTTAVMALSEAERHFGVSPTFNKDVEYQPAVIVMEHGAEAIRANSSDGMTWTLDANAPHAAEIKKDKILFATGRAVGRVLAVERTGDSLAVTLGPVELTEVFEKLHLSYHGALDPSKMIAYYAPDALGTYTDLNESAEPSSSSLRAFPATRFASLYDSKDLLHTRLAGGDELSLRSAVWNPADRTQFSVFKVAMPGTAAFGALTDISVKDYTLRPNCCGGLGVNINYDKNGIKFTASAVLSLKNPHIDVSLDILHGLKNAFVDISGVGGLKVSINGGNSGDVKNLNAIIQLPLDFSYPIPVPITGIGTPFSVVFRQSIRVGTIFTTKGATLGAEGEYQYTGAIRAGIRQEKPVAEGLKMSGTVTDLAETLKGNAGGVNALLLAYGAKIIVGIGAFNFVVGPYAAVDASVGTTRGSDLQAAVVGYVCHSADVNLWMEVGVGYALPQVVVKAINEFLSLFHVSEISSTYSKPIASLPIYEGSKAIPPTCGKP
ncbi:MAG: hypothetical protein M3O26_01540 [Pseudomonadota bacterium]|nr:hypothetical protein [Pseudomonadota bacterium]